MTENVEAGMNYEERYYSKKCHEGSNNYSEKCDEGSNIDLLDLDILGEEKGNV